MDAKQLVKTRETYRVMLVDAILQFVRENGEDLTDYEINEFGLDEGRDGEGTITKVWNFFDYGGCYFFEPDKLNMDDLEDMTDEDYSDKLYENVVYSAYQCLYIVVDENGVEQLKYYRFTNGGVKFDDDQSEPDHDYVSKLSLLDLNYIITGIKLSNDEHC